MIWLPLCPVRLGVGVPDGSCQERSGVPGKVGNSEWQDLSLDFDEFMQWWWGRGCVGCREWWLVWSGEFGDCHVLIGDFL